MNAEKELIVKTLREIERIICETKSLTPEESIMELMERQQRDQFLRMTSVFTLEQRVMTLMQNPTFIGPRYEVFNSPIFFD